MSSSGHASGTSAANGRQPQVDPSRVLVVGKSPINRVVVAKIVERAGLKPISEAPETAGNVLRMVMPGAIVLDGGPDNRDCDGLTASIAAARRASGGNVPVVILLSNRMGTPQSLELPSIVDVVVAKPITPDNLQPVIGRVVGQGRP
jgi:CheY-like chemotaxis protein